MRYILYIYQAVKSYICMYKQTSQSTIILVQPKNKGKDTNSLSLSLCLFHILAGHSEAPRAMSRMVNDSLGQWLFKLVLLTIILLRAKGLYVPITYVQNAVAKGAVCLDGSPPAYHFDKGFGCGINNWVVDIEGGGWCNNISTCLRRKNNHLGSSKLMLKELPFSGIMSNKPEFNPDFYNWNRVSVRYCDGSSFTGDVEAVNPANNLHFRGARVFSAVMEDLLAKGLRNAKNAILSGCSAGGLTTILHCDKFRSLLPLGAKVKCLSDAGFFINTKDVSGGQHIQAYFNDVVTTHGSAKNLPLSCTSKMSPSLCFFPQYFAQQIRTPLFFVNAAYDYWQVRNALVPASADPQGLWNDCKLDIARCTYPQVRAMQGFRMQFLHAIMALGRPQTRGLFINSCFAHCQTSMQDFWFGSLSPKLSNTTIAKAVGDWFYDRKPFQMIDCPYPCDKTCHRRTGDPNQHRI